MQRWLKSITPDRATLEKNWCLKPFSGAVLDRGCWAFNRTSVIRAFSLGLLIAFVPPTPFLPLHLSLCAILGIVFRLNMPVLFSTVFVSNPFTWFPQVFGSIWVGARLMGMDLEPVLHHLTHQNLWAHINRLWAPLLLGASVLGIISATLGYVAAQFFWRIRVLHHLRRRRMRSSLRAAGLRSSAFDQNSVDQG